MKKAVTVFGAAVLAAVFSVGLTACSSAKSVKSDVVTQEAWKQAFAEENFTNVRMEAEMSVSTAGKAQGGKVDYTQTNRLTVVIAGDYEYYKVESEMTGKILGVDVSDEEPVAEMYSARKADGTYTMYTKDASGNWIVSDSAVGVAADIIVGMIGSLSEIYGSYVYSEDRRGYVKADDLDGTEEVLKFKDGKLAAVWVQVEKPDFDDNDFTYAVQVIQTSSAMFTYGGQSLTLPQLTSA